ncbi:MAG: molybdenum cofactor biosynthesis protein MoaE [Bowdeniella nasicola]|nr:molybdenum cofactor biosynthesis protein MoaE [Bowdeniella nasicola]
MHPRIIRACVSSEPIDVAALASDVLVDEAGALVTFNGVVRNHDGGRAVSGIEYSAHPTAQDLVGQVAHDIAARFDVHALAVIHRIGPLTIGQTALGAAVASSHRQEGFAAIAALVDEIKARLPVWKLQRFADGSHEWSNCP